MFGSRMKLAMIFASLSIITAFGWWLKNLIDENDALQLELDAKRAVIERKNTELASLSDDLALVQDYNQTLIDERNDLANMRQQYEKRSSELTQKLRSAHEQINDLRHSDDNEVNQWANTPLPNDAVRMLKLRI